MFSHKGCVFSHKGCVFSHKGCVCDDTSLCFDTSLRVLIHHYVCSFIIVL